MKNKLSPRWMGGLYYITYSGIALRDLVAAIKSLWFETARGRICAFFWILTGQI